MIYLCQNIKTEPHCFELLMEKIKDTCDLDFNKP